MHDRYNVGTWRDTRQVGTGPNRRGTDARHLTFMANWIKVRNALVRSARVRRLRKYLNCKNHFAAIGYAIAWLCWVDEQTLDGHTHLTPEELDEELGMRGGAKGLMEIGWAALDEEGCLVALEFDKHSGDTARQRAENARRKELCVARKKAAAGAQKHAAKPAAKGSGRGRKPKSVPAPEPEKQNLPNALALYPAASEVPAFTAPDEAGSTYSAPLPDGEGHAAGADEPSLEAIVEVMSRRPYPCVPPEEIDRVAGKFLVTMQCRGWRDARGIGVRDWEAAAQHYIMTWSNINADKQRDQEQRERVANERTALMKRDVDSRIDERRHRMDPSLPVRRDRNYETCYEV